MSGVIISKHIFLNRAKKNVSVNAWKIFEKAQLYQ